MDGTHVSGLVKPERGATIVVVPGQHEEAEEAASQEVCALYYAEGDPTNGHRSQHATLYADHKAGEFELESADGERIKVSQQSELLHLAAVTGCVVWNGAVVLSRSLGFWDQLDVLSLRGHRVVELGAGTGLLALVAAGLGAHVVATDQGERLKLLRRNVERESRGGKEPWCFGQRGGTVEVRELDWFLPDKAIDCDLVLATDVVYTEEVTSALVKCIASYAAPAILSVELRTEEVHFAFIEALAAARFMVHRLPLDLIPEDVRTKRVVTYVLTREGNPEKHSNLWG